jgi:nicotinamidase-related amidase
MRYSWFIACGLLAVSFLVPTASGDAPSQLVPNLPKVPGKLRLRLHEQKEERPGSGVFKVVERAVDWDVAQTAIIVCDVWDAHYCKSSEQRIGVMVPKLNPVLRASRSHGVMIIHAPSNVTHVYADTPYRRRMRQAKPAKPPLRIARSCELGPSREPPLPLKNSCDDSVLPAYRPVYTRQHPWLHIVGYDGISDSREEIYNFRQQEGITNIVVTGVHANLCVLVRPFGIRQMIKLGKTVVLARGLTDVMYDSRHPPFVSFARATEMVVEHIEKYWCPSILSDDVRRVVPGSAGPFPEGTPTRGKN